MDWIRGAREKKEFRSIPLVVWLTHQVNDGATHRNQKHVAGGEAAGVKSFGGLDVLRRDGLETFSWLRRGGH